MQRRILVVEDEPELDAAREARAEFAMLKPFGPEELEAAVARLLGEAPGAAA